MFSPIKNESIFVQFLFKVINGRKFAKDSVVRKYNVIPDLSIYPVKAPRVFTVARSIWRRTGNLAKWFFFQLQSRFPDKNKFADYGRVVGFHVQCCVFQDLDLTKSRELVFFRRVVNIEKWYTAATSLFLLLSPACPINNRKQLLWTKNCFSKHRSHYFSHFAH